MTTDDLNFAQALARGLGLMSRAAKEWSDAQLASGRQMTADAIVLSKLARVITIVNFAAKDWVKAKTIEFAPDKQQNLHQ